LQPSPSFLPSTLESKQRLLAKAGGAGVKERCAGLVSDTDLALLAIPVPILLPGNIAD